MKNDQKNPIYPCVWFSCILEQLLATVYDNSNEWHLNNHMWSWNLDLGFKPTSFNLLLVALAQTTSYCHVMIMHHIVHCIDCVSFCVAGICPLSIDVIPMMRSLTLTKTQCYLQKCQASKTPPCSFRYNPTLSLLLSFNALGQHRFICYLLR